MNFLKFERKSRKKYAQQNLNENTKNLNCILVEENNEFVTFTPQKEYTQFSNTLLY